MGPIVLLLSFSLLHLVQSELTPVFVKTGEDLLLNVQTPVTPGDDDQITWKVNDTKVIARFFGFLNQSRIIGSYSGRVTLFEDNFSLLLKSVRKSDSGDYRAHVSGVANKDLAEYKVTVLDPVSPVRLTVNSCSSDSSNLTVTCSTQDSLIRATFTCDNQTCSEERGDRGEFATPGTSLRVYLENGSVICNYSNEVSWTEDIKTIEDLCGKDPKYEFSKGSTNIWAIVVSIVAVVVVAAAVVLVIRVLKKRRKDKTESVENTVYEDVKAGSTNQTQEQRPTNEDPPAETPSTIYHLLGQPTNPEAPAVTTSNPIPESLYATVEKPAKSS